MIEIYNVKKAYQQSYGGRLFSKKKKSISILKGIDLKIADRERVAFVGLNGSGKSTLIKLITGIIKADFGYIKVFRNDSFNKRKENSKNYGVLFGQKSNLIWDLSAKKSFELLKDIYLVDENEYKEIIDYLDSYLQIRHLMEIPVRELSFGQRMKLEISSILIHKPKLVILDEAFIGVDFATKEDISLLFDDYINKFSASLIITSHDISDINLMAERYIIFDEGKIILDINKTEFFKKYKFKKVNIVSKESLFVDGSYKHEADIRFVKELKKMYKDGIYEYKLIIDQRYYDDIVTLTNEHEIYEFQVSNISLEDFIVLYKEGLI